MYSVEFLQKSQFPNKLGFLLSALIILDSINVDLLLFKKESGKNRITINRVCLAIPKRATITWYPYISLFPGKDLWCNIGLSVSGLRKIRFNAYTLRRISTKGSVPKQTRIPVVRIDNFRLQ